MSRHPALRPTSAAAAILLALGTAACGANGTSSTTADSTGSTEPSASKIRISLITGDNRDPFFLTVKAGAQAAADEKGVDLDWQGPASFDPTLQIPILNAVLATSPDAALICATDSKALVAPMAQFMQAGIPVIDGLGCGPIDNPSASLGAVDSNNIEGGKAAGQFLVDALPEGSKVAYIGLAPGNRAGDDRQKGFEDAVKAGGLDYIGPEYVDYDSTKSAAAAAALLVKHPDLRGFFGVDATYSTGIGTAVNEAGLSDKVEIAAYDGTPAEVKLLESGVFDALIVQPAYEIGYKAVVMAADHVRTGAAVPEMTSPDVVTATRDNINDANVQQALYIE